MALRQLLVVLAMASVGGAGFAQAPVESAPDLKGRLYRAVFASGADTLNAADLASLPDSVRGRLATFLERRAAFVSQYESRAASADEAARDAKRRAIERAIVALVDAPDAPGLALRFVADAPVAAEWGEGTEGPLAEAAYAEDQLKKAPDGALAPFLHVFIAQRQRAAFEAAERAGDKEAMKAAAKKYRLFVGRAKGAEDSIYGFIAADLDALPYVNLKSVAHPRDFNPDT